MITINAVKSVYNVLKLDGNYTLLEDVNVSTSGKYVVAYKIEKSRGEVYAWSQGMYFSKLKEAEDKFRELVSR